MRPIRALSAREGLTAADRLPGPVHGQRVQYGVACNCRDPFRLRRAASRGGARSRSPAPPHGRMGTVRYSSPAGGWDHSRRRLLVDRSPAARGPSGRRSDDMAWLASLTPRGADQAGRAELTRCRPVRGSKTKEKRRPSAASAKWCGGGRTVASCGDNSIGMTRPRRDAKRARVRRLRFASRPRKRLLQYTPHSGPASSWR